MRERPQVVTLRPVLPTDLDALYEHQADPASAAMARVPARSRAEFDQHWGGMLGDPEMLVLAVEADGELVGSVLCFGAPDDRRLGYRIARQHWGRGIATAAVGQLLRTVTDRPLYATVATDNAASQRVLERHGFVAAGDTRQDDGVVLRRMALPA